MKGEVMTKGHLTKESWSVFMSVTEMGDAKKNMPSDNKEKQKKKNAGFFTSDQHSLLTRIFALSYCLTFAVSNAELSRETAGNEKDQNMGEKSSIVLTNNKSFPRRALHSSILRAYKDHIHACIEKQVWFLRGGAYFRPTQQDGTVQPASLSRPCPNRIGNHPVSKGCLPPGELRLRWPRLQFTSPGRRSGLTGVLSGVLFPPTALYPPLTKPLL